MSNHINNMKKSLQAAQGSKGVSPVSPADIANLLNPSAHKPAERLMAVADQFPAEESAAFKLGFLGAGQGGGRIAAAFHALGYRRVAALNTTELDFDGLPDDIFKLSFNIGGAAKDAAFARAQLQGREEAIWDLLTRAWGSEVNYGIICAGLGGGTGGGLAMPLVQLAREYLKKRCGHAKVGAVVALPPAGEGQQQARNALNAFQELVKLQCSPLVIIDNAKIHQLYAPPVAELHPRANITVSVLFHLFNKRAASRANALTTFDSAELGQLLDGGIVVMGVANIGTPRSPADVSEGIRKELTNNVLAAVDLTKGTKAACIFEAHEDVLNTCSNDYFEAGFDQLDRIVGSHYNPPVETVIHRGLYKGTAPGLQCYTMISGLQPPLGLLQELAKRGNLHQFANPNSLARHFGLED